MYLEIRRCRFTGWEIHREGEGKRDSRRDISWERDYMREKKKLIYPVEMKDHLVYREEMNRMVYRKKRRDEQDGEWRALPTFLMTLAPLFLVTDPQEAPPGVDSAVTSPGHFFFLILGGIPMFYVGIRQQHLSTFMYLGWDSTPCLKWSMSSELRKEGTKFPPYCAGFKEELTNPSTCAGTTGEKKNVFSLFCRKLTRGNLELGLYTHYQHDGWTRPHRGPAWERSGGKGKRRSPRCLKAAHLWPQWFLVLKDLFWL